MFRQHNDPTLFESPALENANMTVLHCREVLEKTGLVGEARHLDGVEITSKDAAQAALEILQNIRVRAETMYSSAQVKEAEDAKHMAIVNVQAALRS